MVTLTPEGDKRLEIFLARHNLKAKVTGSPVVAVWSNDQYEDFKKDLKEFIVELLEDTI